MRYADPYRDALKTMHALVDSGHYLVIISHRTKHPYAGPTYDLHASAKEWVAARLTSQDLMGEGAIHLLETRAEKIATIASLNCDVFLDDLPEVLNDSSFPKSTKAILFDPDSNFPYFPTTNKINSWTQFENVML
jgi:hypothetical protein